MKKKDDEETRKFQELFEKSIEHWLDKKYAQFGRWTFATIGVAIFLIFLHFLALFNGYEKIADLPQLKDLKSTMRH